MARRSRYMQGCVRLTLLKMGLWQVVKFQRFVKLPCLNFVLTQWSAYEF